MNPFSIDLSSAISRKAKGVNILVMLSMEQKTMMTILYVILRQSQ